MYLQACLPTFLSTNQPVTLLGYLRILLAAYCSGQDEIDDAQKILEERSKKLSPDMMQIKVVPLYAALPPEKQMLAFSPAPANCRKVILSTNIAETSVTIDGIRYVIDSGMVKSRDFNPNTGLDALRGVPVSRAQARQRAGRAGRQASGKCFRLYTEDTFDSFLDFTVPEIQRVSLSSVVLHLKQMQIDDILGFPFMDPPSKEVCAASHSHVLSRAREDCNNGATVWVWR